MSQKLVSSALGLLAACLLLAGPAAAQDNVIIDETGDFTTSGGGIDLQIGDSCYTEEITVTIGALLDAEYNIREADTVISSLTAVPCEDPGDPGEPDEVLGIVEEPDEVLAFTGSSVKGPVSVGFALVGVGGLVLYAAKRTEHDDDPALLD